MLFSTFLMMKDREEAHSEEITAPANVRRDEKCNLSALELTTLKYPCLFGFSLVEDEQ